MQLVPSKEYIFSETESRESILVWRDDDNEGPIKFMVDTSIELGTLLALLKTHYGIEQASMRRLRDLYTNRLYSADEMKVSLNEIRKKVIQDECNQGERLRLERGPIPKAGGLCCAIKVDIFDEKGEKITLKDEFQFSIQDIILDLFEKACTKMNVDPQEYCLYTCNWADEPSKKLKDNSATAEQEGLTEDCTLKLLHFSQGLSDEIRSYEIYYSATGFPQDIKPIGKLSINENRTIEEMKAEIKNLCTKEKGFETPFVFSFNELDYR